MFKGILSRTPNGERRAVRRLATVVDGSRRSSHPNTRETRRQSERHLRQLRERQAERNQRGSSASAATQASWTSAQAAALAEEDAAWAARQPRDHHHHVSQPSEMHAAPLHYDAVDPDTGNSVLQHQFDDLVHRALLRYGPPLPVEVMMENKVVTAASMTPAQQRGRPHLSSSTTDDPTASYMDEVPLTMQDFTRILRKEKADFSVRVDCDGVPLSLMVRNCRYLRAYGGRVNYMRFVRRLPTEDGDEGSERREVLVLSLGMYKMREVPSQDGVRQGPQSWRYSYRMW